MFNNKFTKNDPLAESVKNVMEQNAIRRQVEAALNEELGIESRKVLPHEHHANYDALLEAKIKEALVGNQHKIDANKNGRIDGQDFKLLKKGVRPAPVAEEEQLDERDAPNAEKNKKGMTALINPSTNAEKNKKGMTALINPSNRNKLGIKTDTGPNLKPNLTKEEQLDEISTELARKYVSKSNSQKDKLADKFFDGKKRRKTTYSNIIKTIDKRNAGISLAKGKMTGDDYIITGRPQGKKASPRVLTKEEQLDELSIYKMQAISKEASRRNKDYSDPKGNKHQVRGHEVANEKIVKRAGTINPSRTAKVADWVSGKLKAKAMQKEEISFDSVMEEIAYNLNEQAWYVLQNMSEADQVAFFESLTEEQFELLDENILSELYGAPTPGVGSAASQMSQYKSTMNNPAAQTVNPAARAAMNKSSMDFSKSWNATATRAQASGNAPAMATPTAAVAKPSVAPTGGPGRSPSGPATSMSRPAIDRAPGAASGAASPMAAARRAAGDSAPAPQVGAKNMNKVLPAAKPSVPKPTPRPATTGGAPVVASGGVKYNFNQPGVNTAPPKSLMGGNPNR